MGPRRMDGMPRPQAAGGRPAGAPMQRPQMSPRPQQPMARPMQPQQRPMAPAGQMRPGPQAQRPQQSMQQRPMRPMQQQAAQQEYYDDQPVAGKAPAKRGGTWKVVVQFVLGLAVIAAVAAAIVWLYIKYYQQ